jgi:tetratricopeptide (TPR) repeat protein
MAIRVRRLAFGPELWSGRPAPKRPPAFSVPSARPLWTWDIRLTAMLVIGAFVPVLRNEFVNWDDDRNFLGNFEFRGLTLDNLRWAWTTFWMGVYQPLSWVLFEAEYTLFGLDSRGYHLVNLVLHVINTLVLYKVIVALLERVCSQFPAEDRLRSASALAAALLMAHPLRVEVVAWASCQPYLPCALFSMLAVLAYVRANDRGGARRARWTGLACLCFTVALLFKAAAVCLPVVLIVLDWYPLRRLDGDPRRWFTRQSLAVWGEKLPFAVIAAAAMVIAVQAKASAGTLIPYSTHVSELSSRSAQAAFSVCFYAGKTIWPVGLAAFYPLITERTSLSEPRFAACAVIAVATTAALVLARRRYPGLLAAWAGYLGLLAPNLGLVRISDYLVADRYSYLPTACFAVPLAYGLWLGRRGARTQPAIVGLTGLAGVALVTLSVLTWRQCMTWRSSVALWTHALAHETESNGHASINLGLALAMQGRWEEAMPVYRRACAVEERLVAARPGDDRERAVLSTTLNNYGSVLRNAGLLNEAVEAYHRAIMHDEIVCQGPTKPESVCLFLSLEYFNLAETEKKLGLRTEAIKSYRAAYRIRAALFRITPDDLHRESLATVALELGLLYDEDGQPAAAVGSLQEARDLYQELVRLHPEVASLGKNLDEVNGKIRALQARSTLSADRPP